jgi:hypothetical protein
MCCQPPLDALSQLQLVQNRLSAVGALREEEKQVFFPVAGKADAAVAALIGVVPEALSTQVKQLFVMADKARSDAEKYSADPSVDVVRECQVYNLFFDAKIPFEHFWLDKTSAIGNDSKHLRLTPTRASNILDARTTGLVPSRAVKVRIQSLDALPQLYNWSMWPQFDDLKELTRDQKVALCRNAVYFWYVACCKTAHLYSLDVHRASDCFNASSFCSPTSITIVPVDVVNPLVAPSILLI